MWLGGEGGTRSKLQFRERAQCFATFEIEQQQADSRVFTSLTSSERVNEASGTHQIYIAPFKQLIRRARRAGRRVVPLEVERNRSPDLVRARFQPISDVRLMKRGGVPFGIRADVPTALRKWEINNSSKKKVAFLILLMLQVLVPSALGRRFFRWKSRKTRMHDTLPS